MPVTSLLPVPSTGCPHCKKVIPIFTATAESFKDDRKVRLLVCPSKCLLYTLSSSMQILSGQIEPVGPGSNEAIHYLPICSRMVCACGCHGCVPGLPAFWGWVFKTFYSECLQTYTSLVIKIHTKLPATTHGWELWQGEHKQTAGAHPLMGCGSSRSADC